MSHTPTSETSLETPQIKPHAHMPYHGRNATSPHFLTFHGSSKSSLTLGIAMEGQGQECQVVSQAAADQSPSISVSSINRSCEVPSINYKSLYKSAPSLNSSLNPEPADFTTYPRDLASKSIIKVAASIGQSASQHWHRSFGQSSSIEMELLEASLHKPPQSGVRQNLQNLAPLAHSRQTAEQQEQLLLATDTASPQCHQNHCQKSTKSPHRRSSLGAICNLSCSSSKSFTSKKHGRINQHHQRPSADRKKSEEKVLQKKEHHNRAAVVTIGPSIDLGRPPLQSPSSRHISTHSLSIAARGTGRHHLNLSRRKSDPSKSTKIFSESQTCQGRAHNIKEVQRRFNHNQLPHPLLEESSQQLQQQQQRNRASLCGSSRRWSLSSRRNKSEGHETVRASRCLVGSTIGRRHSTTTPTTPPINTAAISPLHRRLLAVPTFGWLVSLRSPPKINNNNNNNMGAALGNCCAGRDVSQLKR